MDVRLLIRPKSEDTVHEVVVSGRDQFVLGRGSTSAAPLDGPGISREHVAVSLDKFDLLIMDLSVNGAWINGKRLPQREKYRLKAGEILELPGYEVSFKLDNAIPVNGNGQPSATWQSQASTTDAPARSTARKAASDFLGTFSTLDRFVILLALLSVLLVALYFSLS
jgi:predicted component of type VI protein secretion system